MAEYVEISPNEKVLLKLRKHWIILARDAGLIAVFGLLPLVMMTTVVLLMPATDALLSTLPFVSLIFALWLLLTWLTLAVIWTNYYLDLWIVTTARIISIDQISLFQRKVTSIALDSIQEITVHTDNPLEALFHYGTIEIETAGPDDADSIMEGIPNPEHMRNVILEQANLFQQLLEANQNQEQLLHTVSHEVKNFLTKDVAALSSIADGDFDAHPEMLKSVAGTALSEARKGVKEMMALLDKKGLALEIAPFDMRESLLKLTEASAVAAQKKGLSFAVQAPSTIRIAGDEEKLMQLVVKNLIDNAINYTPSGSVTVSLNQVGPVARLIVADTGVGLSEDDTARLFTPGGKGSDSRSINPDSTGYGLAIAKNIIEAHGGRISAESAGPGKGATFIVELPVAQ